MAALSNFAEKISRKARQFHTKAGAGQSPLCMEKRQFVRYGRRKGLWFPPLLSAQKASLTLPDKSALCTCGRAGFRVVLFR
jgi:hypothetical protein